MTCCAFVTVLPDHQTSHTIKLFTLPSLGKVLDLDNLCLQLVTEELIISDGAKYCLYG